MMTFHINVFGHSQNQCYDNRLILLQGIKFSCKNMTYIKMKEHFSSIINEVHE